MPARKYSLCRSGQPLSATARVTGSISTVSTLAGFGKRPRIWPPVMSCTNRRQIGSAPTLLGILRLRGSSKPIHTTTTSSGV